MSPKIGMHLVSCIFNYFLVKIISFLQAPFWKVYRDKILGFLFLVGTNLRMALVIFDENAQFMDKTFLKETLMILNLFRI